MKITAAQKRIIEQVVNVFETGRPNGNYAALTVINDGPHGIHQITYGRSQTTEYGNLKTLLTIYAEAHGQFSAQVRPYLDRLKREPLTFNSEFRELLKRAGGDPVMRRAQDEFFDERYFKPAENWADGRGFTLPLSLLVIYDSFIHSGSVLSFLRSRFAEKPPAFGGDEKAWVEAYVDARHDWLGTHQLELLRKTVYRTATFKDAIKKNNWELLLPVNANGVEVN